MSTGKIVAIMSLIIGWGAIQFVLARGQDASPPPPGKEVQKADQLPALRKARAEAAKKTYEGVAAALLHTHRQGKEGILVQISTPGDVYRWSVRWLEAEKDLSEKKEQRVGAATAHLQRMEKLKKLVNVQVKDLLPNFELDAAEYYRVEAEVWLAQEKAR